MEPNTLAVLALGSILTLMSTLKLTLTGTLYVGPNNRKFVLFHPLWLWFLVPMLPYVVGRYIHGSLSPLPWAAYASAASLHGPWGGVLAGVATTTVDLWLFWATAAAFLSFPIPMSVAYEPIPKTLHKYFYLANLLGGAFIVVRALTSGTYFGPARNSVMTDLAQSTPAPFRKAKRRGLAHFNALEILAVLIGICFWSTGTWGAMIGIPIILSAAFSAFFIPPKIERGLHIGKCPHCGAEMSATHYQTIVDCPCCRGDVAVKGDRFVALPRG